MENNNNIIVQATEEDIQKNKTMAALAYLIFFIPLIACRDSVFGRFHANQGLLLWLLGIVGGILSYIPLIGGIISLVFSIAILVFFIMGLSSALKGQMNPLPIIGKIRIIK